MNIGTKKPCAICGGRGTVENKTDAWTPVDCGTCHGRGYVWTAVERVDTKPGEKVERRG